MDQLSQKRLKISAIKELSNSEMKKLMEEKLEIMKNVREKWDGVKLKKIREELGLKKKHE